MICQPSGSGEGAGAKDWRWFMPSVHAVHAAVHCAGLSFSGTWAERSFEVCDRL